MVVANRVEQTQVQAAVVISKQYKVFEPYGGAKIFRTYLTLRAAAVPQ